MNVPICDYVELHPEELPFKQRDLSEQRHRKRNTAKTSGEFTTPLPNMLVRISDSLMANMHYWTPAYFP